MVKTRGIVLLFFSFWLLLSFSTSSVAAANNLFNFAVFGSKSVTMSGGSYSDSYRDAAATVTKGQYKNGPVGTNSVQSCSISMSGGGTEIFGKALVGVGGNPANGVCASGGSLVYNSDRGTLTSAKDMTPVADPGGGTPEGALNLSGSTRTLTAGDYRYSSITLSGGSMLTLSGAITLHIDGNLTLSGNSRIVVTDGPVVIYANGQKFDVSGGSVVNITNEPRMFTVYGAAGLTTANLSGGGTQHMLFFAPNAAITLSGGQNTFGSVIGNTVTLSGGSAVHFVDDDVPPVISVRSPLSGARLSSALANVTGTVSEAVSSVTVNGKAADVNGLEFSFTGLQLPEGPGTITVRATDAVGNTATLPVPVTVDTVAPAVTITTPLPGFLTNKPLITVSGSVNEDVAILTVNGVATPVSARTFTALVPLAEGPGTIVVQATDLAANSGTASVSGTLDSKIPDQPVITPPKTPTNVAGITISGTAEPNSKVKVFGSDTAVGSATADGQGNFSLAGVILAEGNNTFTATATDAGGNTSGASAPVSVELDTKAPDPPIITPPQTPTNNAAVTISGTAEPGSLVKVSNGTVPLGTVTADPQGRFTVAGVTLGDGTNTFTATATDATNNQSQPSLPVTAVLDTAAPTITVTTPQPGSFLNTPQITITGSVSEPLATLALDGEPVTLTGTDFQKTVTLAAGLNTLTFVATDLAGNPATKTVPVNLDTVAPVVTISAPVTGGSTNAAQVTVTGTISEDSTAATVNGTPVTVTAQAFSFVYTLQEGDNTITVEATDRAGNKGSSSVTRNLDTKVPQVSLLAPAEAAAGANLTVTVNASDNARLGLVELKVDGVAIWSGGNAPSLSEPVSYRLSPSLAAGSEVVFVANGVDVVGNPASATARVKITQGASGPGFIQGKVLDDQRGLLLSGAEVTVTDAKGTVSVLTTADDGGYFTEAAAGSALVRVAKVGFTTVERVVTVLAESKVNPLDARLTPISSKVNLVDSTGAQLKFPLSTASSLAAEVTVPAGALGVQADLRLTTVGNQGLPGVLPAGWSPVAAAEVRLIDPSAGTVLDNPPVFAASLKFPALPVAGVTADSAVVLAAYDVASHGWIAKGSAVPAADGSSVTAAIRGVGQYALLVADPAPNAPPAANQGQPLAPAVPTAVNYDLTTAAGKVMPQATPPSTGIRAAGEVVLKVVDGADPAPQFTSGLVLGGRVTERFDLHSGDRVDIPVYTQHLVLYRSPCVTSIGQGAITDAAVASVRATFPISPSRNFTITDLLLGKVSIEILRPDAMVDGGGVMVGTDGARLLDGDGNVLVIPAGALSQTTPVLTKNGKVAAGAVGADFNLLKAVELNLTYQALASSATLSIPLPSGLDPSLPLVVAKSIDVRGTTKLTLVALAKINGSAINSDTTAPGIALPGITTSGTYYFLQGKRDIGFVAGTVTGLSSAPFRGALVKSDLGSLVDLSAASGGYLLAVPATSITATAVNLDTGDLGSAAGILAGANQILTANLTIQRVTPQVVSVTPADQAINVQPSVQVVVTFSKKIDSSSVTATTLQVTKADGTAVKGVISFNVDGTVATFYPETSLQSEGSYRITVDGSVKDLQGYQIGQSVTSTFTVKKTTPPPMPAAGAVSASFPDSDGFITVTATQGSAAPDNTVFLINDTSGEIVSVTPVADGSFNGKIRGQLGDEVKVVLMDRSGNQTIISYLTYKSPDGKYLVTAKGGKVEGEGGSQLDVPEGALAGPTTIKLTMVTEAGLPHPVPNGGLLLGAVNLDTGGFNPEKPVEISIPAPAGMPKDAVPFLAQPQKYINPEGVEEQVYVIIDSAKVVNGRLTTACPPFGGVLTFGIFAFIYFDPVSIIGGPVIFSGTTYQDMDGVPGYTAGVDLPVSGAVIRSPGAQNFISYSDSKGHYASYGFTVNGVCRGFPITAIHPLTMNRVTVNLFSCDAPYIVNNFNFRLADKDTIPPDHTPPTIEASLQTAPGQPPANRIMSGTVPVGTEMLLSLFINDQSLVVPSVKIDFTPADLSGAVQYPVTTTLAGSGTYAAATADRPEIKRYMYSFGFNAIQGSQPYYFKPQAPGVYRITITATDGTNHSEKTIQVRAIASEDVPVGIDGAPVVDSISPPDQAQEIVVATPITVFFNEPVDVTGATLELLDMGATPPAKVDATVSTSYVDGRMQAVLLPKNNLKYGNTYKVIVHKEVSDINPNLSANNGFLTVGVDYTVTFQTKGPRAFDLALAQQFTGGRDIDLYSYTDASGAVFTYAYLAAGDQGWRVVDVTNPLVPTVVFPQTSTYTFPTGFTCRSVAVHPDKPLMAMTDSVFFADGNQYGYIRFYDLSDPKNPTMVGKERLAEAYSGIPGRIAMQGDYAYIATAGAALQVVSISDAIDEYPDMSDGSAIVGAFDSTGQNFGSPNDITIYGPGKALLTTNSRYLIGLDINNPVPALASYLTPAALGSTRVAAVSDFPYKDGDGNDQTMDLALSGGNGSLATVNVTDLYHMQVITQVRDTNNNIVSSTPFEISINKDKALAYVTTLDSIQVIDVRNPFKPILLNEIRQLPDASGTNVLLGATMGLAQKDGWVYLANQKQGAKVVQLATSAIDVFATPLLVDEKGFSLKDLKIRYQVNLKDIVINNSEINLYKIVGGVKTVVFSGAAGNQMTGSVVVLNHTFYDINASYEAEAVLNPGASDALKSYRTRIPVTIRANPKWLVTHDPTFERDYVKQYGEQVYSQASVTSNKAVFTFANSGTFYLKSATDGVIITAPLTTDSDGNKSIVLQNQLDQTLADDERSIFIDGHKLKPDAYDVKVVFDNGTVWGENKLNIGPLMTKYQPYLEIDLNTGEHFFDPYTHLAILVPQCSDSKYTKGLQFRYYLNEKVKNLKLSFENDENASGKDIGDIEGTYNLIVSDALMAKGGSCNPDYKFAKWEGFGANVLVNGNKESIPERADEIFMFGEEAELPADPKWDMGDGIYLQNFRGVGPRHVVKEGKYKNTIEMTYFNDDEQKQKIVTRFKVKYKLAQ